VHANWGKATTTGGAGNLTLAAITGYPTPYQCAAGRQFPYVALTAQETPLEAGFGYMSDASTFVRTRVVAQYSGGTVTHGNLTAMTLPNGARIVCSPHAASIEAMMPVVDDTSGVGRFVTTGHRNQTTANHTAVSLQAVYHPFLLRCGGVVASMAINVVTAAASGGQAQLALYALKAGSGGVGDRINGAYTAAFAVDTTGFKVGSLNTPQFLPPGMYVAALEYQGSGLVLTGHATTGASLIGGSPFGFNGNSTTAIEYRTENLGSLALPSSSGTTTASTLGTAPAPMIYLGVQ
jgi:hypothetical protein